MRGIALALGLLGLAVVGWPAAVIADPVQLDSALSSARTQVDAPAATATVMACRQVVWAGASGTTQLHGGQPVTPATRFMLASATKTVTATMVMQQVQAGRLSLRTPLARFYPQLPGARRITLRMLLNHTSGLPDYLNNPRLSSIIDNQSRHRWTRAEIIAAVARMRPGFAPGTRYQYSNTNYIVLGGILQQVSHRSIEADFQRGVAQPAGLTASTFTYRPARSYRFAHPYVQSNDGSLSDDWTPGLGLSTDYWGPVFTDGGLASTATDLARFGQALFGGRLVNQPTLANMLTLGRFDYGLGVYDQHFDGHHWFGHDGDYGGYESEDWTDPTRQLTITVTTDLTEADSAPDTASDRIWRAVVADYDGAAGTASCAG